MKVCGAVGRKIRAVAVILVLVGVYAFFMCFFFSNLGWQVALALALTLPVTVLPAALVWYINIRGACFAIRHRT